MSENSDLNPVFHYRAGFRAFAARLQKWLLLGGLAFTLIGLIGSQFTKPVKGTFCAYCALASLALLGGVLFVLGIAWGFHWRKKIRDEFRSKFGP